MVPSWTLHVKEAGSRSILRRFQKSLHEIGLTLTLQIALKKVVPTRYMSWTSFFLIEGDWRNLSVADLSFEGIRMIHPSDATLLEQASILQQPLQGHLARGARVSICEMNGEIAGIFVYDTRHHQQWDWLQIDMSEDVVWCTSVWVAPSQRGKGLHHRMRAFNVRNLGSEGYYRMLAIVDAWNVSPCGLPCGVPT